MMLHLALILLCLAQILHLSRHWLKLTKRMQEDAKDERIRHHLQWKNAHSHLSPRSRAALARR